MTKRTLFVLASMSILVLLAYAHTCHFAFHLDDLHTIRDNEKIRTLDFATVWHSHVPTRFVTFVTLAINYRLGGLDVFSYHIFNISIHVLNGWLVFFLLTSLLRAYRQQSPARKTSDYDEIVPAVAALIFVSHPIQTQAVTYIIQRAASLATFFYLAALALYVQSRLRQSCGWSGVVCYASSLICAILAMMTKEISFTLPIAIFMLELFFFSTSWRLFKARLLPLAPFLLTLLIIPVLLVLKRPDIDIRDIGKIAVENPLIPRWQYFFTQLYVVCTYLRLLLLPVRQNLDYDYPLVQTAWDAMHILPLLLLGTIFVLALRLFHQHRLPSFAILFFFLALSVESSFVPISDVIFEHRLYLPSLGFTILVASGFASWLQRIHSTCGKRILGGMLLLLVSVLTWASYERNKVWQNKQTIWQDVVRKSPNKWRGYNNLGVAYEEKGDYRQAMELYKKSAQLSSNRWNNYNLGNVYYALGRYEEALEFYKQAWSHKHTSHIAMHIGLTFSKLGQYQEALRAYEIAIETKQNNPLVYYNQGILYEQLGQEEKAVAAYQQALEHRLYWPQVYNNLGSAHLKLGNTQQAEHNFKIATDFTPAFAPAYHNLAMLYYLQNRLHDARALWRTALQLDPGNSEVRSRLEEVEKILEEGKN